MQLGKIAYLCVSVTAMLTTACVLFQDGIKASQSNQTPMPQIKASCERITDKPALYRCSMSDGSVCYVALTGVSCLLLSVNAMTLDKLTPSPLIPFGPMATDFERLQAHGPHLPQSGQ